jgi:hypothetical protein
LDFNQLWSTEGKLPIHVNSSLGLPNLFACIGIQCERVWIVTSVARQDQQLVDQDRGTAIAVRGWIRMISVFPNQITLEICAGSPLMTEMQVDTIPRKNRRWACVRVLIMDFRGIIRLFKDHLAINLFARFGI